MYDPGNFQLKRVHLHSLPVLRFFFVIPCRHERSEPLQIENEQKDLPKKHDSKDNYSTPLHSRSDVQSLLESVSPQAWEYRESLSRVASREQWCRLFFPYDKDD